MTALAATPGMRDDRAMPQGPYPIGLAAILVTVAMLFTAFTSALVIRRTGTDWVRIALPPIVWANTLVLLLSSVALERARAAARRDLVPRIADWLGVAAVLGVLFLAGQWIAWRELVAQGILLRSGPHPAFFYMLSAVHAAHVIGGLGALAWTLNRARGGAYGAAWHVGLNHTAIYWHFVGGVWLWLLAVLSTL